MPNETIKNGKMPGGLPNMLVNVVWRNQRTKKKSCTHRKGREKPW
jgi:hypothetical protein